MLIPVAPIGRFSDDLDVGLGFQRLAGMPCGQGLIVDGGQDPDFRGVAAIKVQRRSGRVESGGDWPGCPRVLQGPAEGDETCG